MSRYTAFLVSVVALSVATGLCYLSYRLIASGIAGDHRDLWAGGVYALLVGIAGWYPLAVGIGAACTAVTGRVSPAPEKTRTARTTRTTGAGGAEVGDGGDWDD